MLIPNLLLLSAIICIVLAQVCQTGHSWRAAASQVSSNRILEYINIFPCAMDELPIEQSRSLPVNPSHVTINGLAHYWREKKSQWNF